MSGKRLYNGAKDYLDRKYKKFLELKRYIEGDNSND